jgi:hypothetical protein
MSNNFDDTFAALEILSEIGIRLVPERPTQRMCQAGSAAGDIDQQTVMRVYNAMLVAASSSALHGDHSLN